MSALQSFVFEDEAQSHAVRAVLREGEPWFVAKDVCSVLGVQNVSQAMESLDDDERVYVQHIPLAVNKRC